MYFVNLQQRSATSRNPLLRILCSVNGERPDGPGVRRCRLICANLQLAMISVANAFRGSADSLIAGPDWLTPHERIERAAANGLRRVGRGEEKPAMCVGLDGLDWLRGDFGIIENERSSRDNSARPARTVATEAGGGYRQR